MNLSLIRKFFAGKCNQEEATAVLKWIRSKESINEINQLFDDFDESQFNQEVDSEGILHKIQDRINMEDLINTLEKNYRFDRVIETKKKNYRSAWVMRIAASVIILLSVSFGIYILNNEEDYSPDTNKENKLITKTTEKGQKLTIHLGDGSKVILNAASSLTYLDDFSDSLRQVSLIGEAYFEVNGDTLRPFVVKSGNLLTKALGTSFNIEYRQKINKNNVALIQGSVEVRIEDDSENAPLLLEPGQMVELDAAGIFLKKSFSPDMILAWKDGIIYFHNSSYQEVISELGMWYGVNFKTIGQPDNNWKFTAKFENENLRNILDALKFAQKLDYKLNNKEVTIQFE